MVGKSTIAGRKNDPTEFGETHAEQEVTLGFKGMWARLRGEKVIWFFLGMTGFTMLGAVQVYAIQQSMVAHQRVEQKLDNGTCVNSLSQTQKDQMRHELTDIARVGGNVRQHMIINYCPWMAGNGS